MGFTYFGKKKWIEISREERLFCAHLYWAIKNKENGFIKWISQRPQCRIQFTSGETRKNWEIGYEVCLYREFYKVIKNMPIKGTKFPQKRTFDLCLFSEKRIIIIEAKAHQGFTTKQIIAIKKDKKKIRKLLGDNIEVSIVSITSSKYNGKLIKQEPFDLNLTWNDVYEFNKDKLFLQADKTYKN